ncbi:uroporphyrinogen decarboxylase family protein [candidate division KSB1 bacterium]
MNRRERVFRAIEHRDTDIVPYDIDFTVPAREKMIDYYGDADFEEKIGNHLARIEAVPSDGWIETEPDIWRDEFGVVWNRSIDKDIGTPELPPMIPEPTLDGYTFPDPYLKSRYAGHTEFIASYPDRFRINDIGFTLFERAWTLRGMESFLTDMIVNPDFTNELLDKLVEFNVGIVDGAAKFDFDGIMFGDDWGQQRGLIMGPDLWRKYFKPRIAEMYKAAHDRDLAVFIHSCGDIKAVLPDLIEVGVDVLNPFQPEVMDPYETKKTFGDRISFYGGMSTQKTLPYASVDQVKAETKKLLKHVGRSGGFIFSPAHQTPGDVPAENMAAMIEVLMGQ